jgi:hypothetical protein
MPEVTELSASDRVQIGLLAIAIVSALVAALTLLQRRNDARVERSLALIARWHHPDLAVCVRRAHELIAAPPPRTEIDPYEPAFFLPLLFLTELALSVKSGIVEEDVLYDYFGPAILFDYPQIVWWVCKYRELTRSKQRFAAIDFLHEKWLYRREFDKWLASQGVAPDARRRQMRGIGWPDVLSAEPCRDMDGDAAGAGA